MPILVKMLCQIFSASRILPLNPHYRVFAGQVSVVNIMTRYGFDSPWIELWWGQDFP